MEMLIAALVVVLVLISAISVFVFARTSTRPVDRLDTWMSAYEKPEAEEERKEYKGLLQSIGARAEKAGIGRRISERTQLELIRADIPLTGYEFNIARGIAGIVLGLVVSVLTRTFIVGIIAFVCTWFLASVYISSVKTKRLKMFSGQLGDALTLFSNSLRAGFSFMQAVSSVAREMPDPISKEFTKLLKEMSLGLSTEKALSNFLMRVPLDDLELLIMAILIQKEVGGNLAEIIDNIANTIRERITIQLEIKTLVAQGKMSGLIIGLLPIFLTAVLSILNPAYMSLLYTTTIGKILVVMGLGSMLIGAVVISKIVKIEV